MQQVICQNCYKVFMRESKILRDHEECYVTMLEVNRLAEEKVGHPIAVEDTTKNPPWRNH